MLRKALALLVTVSAVNLLFFTDWPSSDLHIPFIGTIGFALLVLAANTAIHLLQKQENKDRYQYALVFSGLAVLYSVIATLRGSFLDAALLNLSSIISTFVALYFVISQRLPFDSWLDIILSPLQAFRGWLEGGSLALADVSRFRFGSKLKSTQGQLIYIVLGLMFLVPTVFILVGLLSSADPVFGSQFNNLFKFQLPQWLANRGLFTIGALAFVTPFLYVQLTDRGYRKEGIERELGKMTVTALTVVIPVAFILGMFLLIQSHYLFADVSETELHQFGVQTYSEYVRRGFGELVVVSFITFLTAVVSLVVYQNRSNSNRNILRIVNTILLAEIIIFIFSIFRRVYLYQELHGLTRARVYGSGFLILMLVLTLILILRHYAPRIKWHLYEMGIVALFMLVITTIGVDRIIANDTPPTVNHEIDYVYIARLSPDAIDKWHEAFRHAKFEIVNNPDPITDDQKRRVMYALWTVDALVQHYQEINHHAEIMDIRNFNIARWEARSTYNMAFDYGAITATQKKANEIYDTFRYEPINYLDRSTDTPLLY